MNRILTIFGVFRHALAEGTLLQREPLTLIRPFVSASLEQREPKRRRNSLLKFPAPNDDKQRDAGRKSPLTMRWELVQGDDGRKSLRMKWNLAGPAQLPALTACK